MIDPLRSKHIATTKLMNPDCRDGKHPTKADGPTAACQGWDLETDQYCPCPCPCHYPPKDGHE